MIITTVAKNETHHVIQGPAGKLELVVGQPLAPARGMWGVVCHPHPLFRGTMHNKVVTTLAKTFQSLGLNTIRFNFRSAGKSEGEYDKGVGEVDDLRAVVEWVQEAYGSKEIWLAGFSFGAYVAAKAALQLPVSQLITVAPPVEHFPMLALPPIICPWILAQGERDDVVSPDAVFAWAESRDPEPVVLRFPEADHFFHGQLTELRTRLEETLAATRGGL